MEQETTTIQVFKTDIKLAKRIMTDLGVDDMKNLFHVFVKAYYETRSGSPITRIVEEGLKNVQ